jgi:type VI secretion system Hcp family effector
MKSIKLFSAVLFALTPLFGMKSILPLDKPVFGDPVIGAIQIEGIKQGVVMGGQAAQSAWININGFEWGSPGSVDTPAVSARGAGNQPVEARSQSSIVIFKEIDRASSNLFQAWNKKEMLKSVVIALFKTSADGKQTVYKNIRLSDAYISKIVQGPSTPSRLATSNSEHMEEVDFKFGHVEIQNTNF